ncbi:MAG: asparagine synthase (glutamine-hydrolyzing) [Deltaproteobacteria bacterium]|jgi:asparagine synthase (glutamine-hydrolysing)|nr:asparagine synthase (glutamine-hydrolyzing) [Deltaproteobacteria bacterium]
MCGIAGILHAEREHHVREPDLTALRDGLRHRGPDDEGLLIDGACGLVHTRLAILDLSSRAHQPMASSSGRYLLSYNGEIYNYRELRAELERSGRSFRTTSDTEVILELMERGGVEALEALRGMFAFGLFDRETRELLLMRDRLGIKPLFWTEFRAGIAFASEPKVLRGLAAGGRPAPAHVAEYLAFRLVADTECLTPGVRTLEPGQRLASDGREHRVETYWRPQFGRDANPDEVDAVVGAAVRRQLVSDVPVGTFLSGGVDSALVTAFAVEQLPHVDTFTVSFQDPSWDESPRAHWVSEALGARAHGLQLTPEQYIRGLGEAIWYLDAPLNHAHSVHLLALSRFARQTITVGLTGEGSDELFAGYPRYRLFRIGRMLCALPRSLRQSLARQIHPVRPRWARLLEAASSDPLDAASRNAAFAPLEDAAALAGLDDPLRALERRREMLEEAAAEGRNALECLLELDRRTYIVSLLQRMDRMSMAAGLETRVPLLDEEVVDFAGRLDSRHKLSWRDSKIPMRRAAERRFGRDYVRAPKSGFGVPVGDWMRRGGPMEPLVERVFEDSRTRQRGWFDVDRARRLFAEHRSGNRDRTEILWGLLNLELWGRVCTDGDGAEGVPLG